MAYAMSLSNARWEQMEQPPAAAGPEVQEFDEVLGQSGEFALGGTGFAPEALAPLTGRASVLEFSSPAAGAGGASDPRLHPSASGAGASDPLLSPSAVSANVPSAASNSPVDEFGDDFAARLSAWLFQGGTLPVIDRAEPMYVREFSSWEDL